MNSTSKRQISPASGKQKPPWTMQIALVTKTRTVLHKTASWSMKLEKGIDITTDFVPPDTLTAAVTAFRESSHAQGNIAGHRRPTDGVASRAPRPATLLA
jgi:hypothetical protein